MEIKRDLYLNRLIAAQGDGLIKVITGIRRCGKSYLLDPIFKNYLIKNGVKKSHIIKIELDRPENSHLLDPQALNTFIKSKIKDSERYYILLDEIQLVPNFESVLNGLLYDRNLDVYVTGSNSKFLSSDIITEFRGRGEEIRVYPLSFAEFMSVYGNDKLGGWSDYITYGGLPLTVSMKTDEQKMEYLSTQCQNVYLNDVVDRNQIKDAGELEAIVKTLASSIGSLTNPKKLSDTFKSASKVNIPPQTVNEYLQYLEEAFLVEKSERYDVKGKRYINTPYKFYFTDLGIRNAFINFRQHEEAHIMENVIYLELKRRGYNVDVGVVEARERKDGELKYKQLEVDFVANRGNNRIYIQSALSMPTQAKLDQEERPFLKIGDSFKKIIVTRNAMKRTRDENGVAIMDVFDFLLDGESLGY